jgi:hypothetical protein
MVNRSGKPGAVQGRCAQHARQQGPLWVYPPDTPGLSVRSQARRMRAPEDGACIIQAPHLSFADNYTEGAGIGANEPTSRLR